MDPDASFNDLLLALAQEQRVLPVSVPEPVG